MVIYEIDKAHTTVGFTAKHLAVSTVRGQFNKFDGRFEGPDDDVTKTTGEVKIEVASIDTRTEMRDNHLRSADFFEAEVPLHHVQADQARADRRREVPRPRRPHHQGHD